MSKLRRRRVRRACAIVVAVLGGLTGCAEPGSRVALVSYKDPYFPETYRVTLRECTYRLDACGDLHVAGRAAASAGAAPSDAVTQLLHVHLFWQPHPGRTFAEPTTTDATIRYVVATPTGAAVYAGTGFVYPKRQGQTLTAEIESATLQLQSQVGEVPEVLGDVRLSGTLVARKDAHTTLDVVRQLERHAAGN
jgi:hypothetical protein